MKFFQKIDWNLEGGGVIAFNLYIWREIIYK